MQNTPNSPNDVHVYFERCDFNHTPIETLSEGGKIVQNTPNSPDDVHVYFER